MIAAYFLLTAFIFLVGTVTGSFLAERRLKGGDEEEVNGIPESHMK